MSGLGHAVRPGRVSAHQWVAIAMALLLIVVNAALWYRAKRRCEASRGVLVRGALSQWACVAAPTLPPPPRR